MALTLRSRRIWVVVAAIVLLGLFFGLAMVRVFPITARYLLRMIGTETESIARYTDIEGSTFDVIYENDDFIAKQESVSIYASVTGGSTGGALIFKYDPGAVANRVPFVTASDSGQVLVTVQSASYIFCETTRWNGLRIKFSVDHVFYPRDIPVCPNK